MHLIRKSIRYIRSKDHKAFTAQLKKVYGIFSLKAAERDSKIMASAFIAYRDTEHHAHKTMPVQIVGAIMRNVVREL